MTSVFIVLAIAIASFVIASVGLSLTLSLMHTSPRHKAHSRGSKS